MTSEYIKIEKLFRIVTFLRIGSWVGIIFAFVMIETDPLISVFSVLAAFWLAYVCGLVNDNAKKRLKRFNKNLDNPNRL